MLFSVVMFSFLVITFVASKLVVTFLSLRLYGPLRAERCSKRFSHISKKKSNKTKSAILVLSFQAIPVESAFSTLEHVPSLTQREHL